MSEPAATPRGTLRELGRFLEIQNLGLNLSFAFAFLLVAARGFPAPLPLLLIVIAFIAARNAGHSFNRWTDRFQDAQNPRTKHRALVVGRFSPSVALGLAAGNGAIVVAAAYFLNPLAFTLSPIALLLVFGYSYTKRFTPLTTVFLGLVEAVTPAAVFVAVRGMLPFSAAVAALSMIAWGTAFETIHSLGDLDIDRKLGLHSIPARIGSRASVALVPLLHAAALVGFAAFGALERLNGYYFGAIFIMTAIVAWTDIDLARGSKETVGLFRRHFVLGGVFLVGAAVALFLPQG